MSMDGAGETHESVESREKHTHTCCCCCDEFIKEVMELRFQNYYLKAQYDGLSQQISSQYEANADMRHDLNAQLPQAQLIRMDHEIEPCDEVCSDELGTKLSRLHTRTQQRIQELGVHKLEFDQTRQQASEAFKPMDSKCQQRESTTNNTFMDDSAPQSLFLVLSYKRYRAPHDFCKIIQLERQVNNLEYVANFRQPEERPYIKWVFSPTSSSTEDLYMVPVSCYEHYDRLHGISFNWKTNKCKRIMAPKASNLYKQAVTLGGDIYLMAHSISKCYNPKNGYCGTIEPIPGRTDERIVATAVWNDTILLNIDRPGRKIWAYNTGRDKWYPVHVEDDECYNIEGEAVVVENTIYALTQYLLAYESILALSIEMEENINRDLVYKCSLRSKILVPGIAKTLFDCKERYKARHLVHLGKDNLCLVQSIRPGFDYILGCQPIQVTNIKRNGENSMTVTDRYVHMFPTVDQVEFEVSLCFSMPKCKTIAFKQGGRFRFDIDPFPEAFESEQEDETDSEDVESEQED